MSRRRSSSLAAVKPYDSSTVHPKIQIQTRASSEGPFQFSGIEMCRSSWKVKCALWPAEGWKFSSTAAAECSSPLDRALRSRSFPICKSCASQSGTQVAGSAQQLSNDTHTQHSHKGAFQLRDSAATAFAFCLCAASPHVRVRLRSLRVDFAVGLVKQLPLFPPFTSATIFIPFPFLLSHTSLFEVRSSSSSLPPPHLSIALLHLKLRSCS